jgi:hypothetical protein
MAEKEETGLMTAGYDSIATAADQDSKKRRVRKI